MSIRYVLSVVAAACLGALLSAALMYRFFTGFMDAGLNLRYSTEVMYSALQQGDYDKISRQLRARIVPDAMGLQMQCESLTAAQKVRAAELFQKMSKLGVDASSVPGLIPNGAALAGCPT